MHFPYELIRVPGDQAIARWQVLRDQGGAPRSSWGIPMTWCCSAN